MSDFKKHIFKSLAMLCDSCGEKDAHICQGGKDADLAEAIEYFKVTGWSLSEDGKNSYCPTCCDEDE